MSIAGGEKIGIVGRYVLRLYSVGGPNPSQDWSGQELHNDR